MDWFSVLSGLLLLFFFNGEAYGAARKKIRIHIPQKVKHIHHHKKIYITKHPVQAQPTQFAPQFASPENYAPAFLADPAVLLPASEDMRASAPAHSPAPNLQPMYRARGHYGPAASYGTSERRQPPLSSSASSKRIKIIKISDNKKKRVSRKKPKRIIIKDMSSPHDEKDSNPTSTFHDEFYSDLSAANHNTFKTLRKPKRVEKYIDGDTEHIHTYSEEHIHQVVYDGDAAGKPAGPAQDAAGLESAPRPLMPLDVALHHAMQAPVYPTVVSTVPTGLHRVVPAVPIALQPAMGEHSVYAPMNTVGSLGTPAHMQYMEYRPHEATHDHVYHDHGEIIHNIGFQKPSIAPSKESFSSQAFKMTPTIVSHGLPIYGPGFGAWVPQNNAVKNSGHNSDLSSFEKFISSKKKEKKNPAASHSSKYASFEDASSEISGDDSSSENVKGHTSLYFGKDNKKDKKKHPAVTSNVSHDHNKKSKKPPVKSHHHHHHHHHHSEDFKPLSTMSSFIDPDIYRGNRINKKERKEIRPVSSSSPYVDSEFNKFKSYVSNYKDSKEITPYSTIGSFGYTGSSHKPRSNSYKEIKPYSSEATYADTDIYKYNKRYMDNKENKPRSSMPSFTESNSYRSQDFGDVKDSYLDSYKYKDLYSSPDTFGIDAFESSSLDHIKKETLPDSGSTWRLKKNKSKKKSISTQNISFGGQDHKTIIDHFAESSNISPTIDTSIHDAMQKPVLENKAFSPSQNYYEAIAEKAFDGSSPIPEASNTNFRIVQAPQMREAGITLTERPQITEASTALPAPMTHLPIVTHSTTTTKMPRKQKKKAMIEKKPIPDQSKAKKIQIEVTPASKPQASLTRIPRGKYKYGDRLQERYDYEYDDSTLI